MDTIFQYDSLKGDNCEDEESLEEFNTKSRKKGKKRNQKQREKVVAKEDKEINMPDAQRLVPKGFSVFDLIMPWKNEIVQQKESALEK
jgi:hypothetical protein